MGTILRGSGIILALVLTPLTASAFNLPPINLGFTNFMDGGAPPGPQPGVYFLEYLHWFHAEKFRDAKGNTLPGSNRVSVFSSVNQLALLSPLKEPLTQGLLGWDLVIPLSVFHARTTSVGPPGGLKANSDVLGDLIFGPFIQWNDHSLFDLPYLHRFEMDVSAPTGSYNKVFDLNPGSNLWTVNPYYAHTLWLPRLDVEISLRHHWLYSTDNPQTEIKPGQAYHVNYAASYGLTRKVRVGGTAITCNS